MSNVEPLLRWIPACAGMTMYTVMPSLLRWIPASAGMTTCAVLASCRHAGLDKPALYLIRGHPEDSSMDRQPAVYILANKRNGTLYVGVTSDLIKRIWQHRNNVVQGFTKRYSVHQLVYYELHDTMESAITKEKTLKNWKRAWKLQLIESNNPNWQDLYGTIIQ